MSFPQPSVNVIYFGELRKVESVNVRFIESLVKQKIPFTSYRLTCLL